MCPTPLPMADLERREEGEQGGPYGQQVLRMGRWYPGHYNPATTACRSKREFLISVNMSMGGEGGCS